MNAGDVNFKFTGDNSNLNKAIDGVVGSFGKMGDAGKAAIGAFVKGTAVLGGALTTVVGMSVKAFADVEQSTGGVETLFKDNADIVIENAKRAYSTAGMSANQYMETVTSFSASLLQSLSGDTKKASTYADQAIVDMADNANKMGTDMGSIEVAYQGFAKQNFTMLDNLKLGYGGTKEEMQRLIADANKIKVANGQMADLSINSFADMTEAIHLVQTQMGITGTTAKEAATTITGSINSAKSAWSNFLGGTGDINAVITTFVTAGTNISNAVNKMGPQIITGLVGLINGLIPQVQTLIQNLLPAVMTGVMSLIQGLISAFPSILNMIASILPQILAGIQQSFIDISASIVASLPTIIPAVQGIVTSIINTLAQMLPQLLETGIQIILAIVNGIVQSLPQIMTALAQGLNGVLTAITNNLPAILNSLMNGIMIIAQSLQTILPQLIQSLVAMLPQIIQSLIQIAAQVITILAQMLPTLLPQIVQAILGIIPILTQNMPLFINAGIQILFGLINGIIYSIPSLIEALPQIVQAIISGLLEAVPLILGMAPTLIYTLSKGILSAIPSLLSLIVTIPISILQGLKQGFLGAFDIGKNLISGLWNGIADMGGWIVNKVKGLGSSIIDSVKGIFGVHSPSTEFAWIGKMNAVGLIKGMDDMQADVQQSLDGMFDLSPQLYGSSSMNMSPNVTVNVNSNYKSDPLGQMVSSVKTFSGGSKNDQNYGYGGA